MLEYGFLNDFKCFYHSSAGKNQSESDFSDIVPLCRYSCGMDFAILLNLERYYHSLVWMGIYTFLILFSVLLTLKTIVLQIIMASNYFSDIFVCSFSFTFIATFENPLKKVKKVSVSWKVCTFLSSVKVRWTCKRAISPLWQTGYFFRLQPEIKSFIVNSLNCACCTWQCPVVYKKQCEQWVHTLGDNYTGPLWSMRAGQGMMVYFGG